MKVENLVPEVYYKDSRDFAFMGRCFELIFNYIKSGADCVNVNYLTDAIDSNIVELMADTVGFTTKHKYNSNDLLAVAGSFQRLLRNKGSLYAVELAVRILMNAQKISDKELSGVICEIDPDDPFTIRINLPEKLSDIVLLEDIFYYILPAGMDYKFVKKGQSPEMSYTYITSEDEFEAVINTTTSDIAKRDHGLNISQIGSSIIKKEE